MHAADVRPLGGGINSETWLVEHQGSTYVAKRVPPTAVGDLVAGCEVAAALAEAGFVTGPPVPTSDGRLVLTDHALALLEHVPGRELEGETDEEQRWIASTLAGVHLAGQPGQRSKYRHLHDGLALAGASRCRGASLAGPGPGGGTR